MKRSVWLRLYLPAVALLLAAAAAAALLSRGSAVRAAREKAYQALRLSAERQALQLRALVSDRFDALSAFAVSLSGDAPSAADALSLLRARLPGNEYRKTAVVSANGIAYYDDGVTADVAGDEGFLAVLGGEASVEARLGKRGIREGRLVLTVPFGGMSSGWTALCGITDRALTELLALSSGTDGTVFLAAQDGSILIAGGAAQDSSGGSLFAPLSRSAGGESAAPDGADSALSAMQAAFMSGASGCCTVDLGEIGLYYAAYVPAGLNDWMLAVLAPCAEPEYGLAPILALTAAALLLLTLFTGLVSARLRRQQDERVRLVRYGAQTEDVLRESGAALWRYEPSGGFRLSAPPFSVRETEDARRALSAEAGEKSVLPACRDAETAADGSGIPEAGLRPAAADPLASRISPESRRAFRQMMERLARGERTVREVVRIRGGRYLRLTFRNRFGPTGEPCGAEGCAEDWTLRQDLRRRIDRQNSRLEDEPRDFLLAARWNLTRDVLEKGVGLPEDGAGDAPCARLCAALSPMQPSDLSLLTSGRLLRLHDVCADGLVLPFDRRTAAGREPVQLDVRLLREPDTLDVLAFLFLTLPEEK